MADHQDYSLSNRLYFMPKANRIMLDSSLLYLTLVDHSLEEDFQRRVFLDPSKFLILNSF